MMIVDSHCHASPTWFEPVESLLFQMDRYGVAQAVLVQDLAQPDNDYQAECVRRYPGRFASVVAVDVERPDAVHLLEGLAAAGASGLRLRPRWRSPGDDPLAIWRAAARLGLVVSCAGRSPDYGSEAFVQLLETLPELVVVIEHLGSGNHPGAESVAPAVRHNVFALARFPNVHVKIHGLGEFAERAPAPDGGFPFVHPIPPLLELAAQAFGPSRLMWGSDYPPVSSREGYGNSLRLTMEQFRTSSPADRAEIFGKVAQRLFFDHRPEARLLR
jgi:L-fuconolactonase